MADKAYTYAVARIRAKEINLLSDSDIEQLMACKNIESCMNFLHEKGWGNGTKEETIDEMLQTQSDNAWKEMDDLVPDKKVFSIFYINKEYHNLKTAIKQVCSEDETENAYYRGMKFSPEELKGFIEKKEFEVFDKKMATAAREATEALLHTQDGQLCDIIIDKACLESIYAAGEESHSEFIENYANDYVSVANIRMAVRCAKTGKSKEFMERTLVNCKGVDVNTLIGASTSVEEICNYLESTSYSDAIEYIKDSSSAFERWCDNRIMETLQKQKYNPFSEGPILAYVLARENEIKTVRIILTCKLNNLSEEFIRERVRKMYV
ncbi:MAG: V-type ATP synthase subunit C [Lachnospiraceae bacterium]|nr:V-type ATP synthase subunit C [Lachnospiraceae bacterium]